MRALDTRAAGAVVLTFLLASPVWAQAEFELLFSAERAVVRAADADGNGAVSGAEWMSFVAAIHPNADGGYDRREIVAHVVAPNLDTDGDRRFTGVDVAARLAALDADGSGALDAGELDAAIWQRDRAGAGARGQGDNLILEGIVGFGADRDQDGTVDAAEWGAATGGPEGSKADVPTATLVAWIMTAEQRVPSSRNALAPSTLLLSVKASLDANRDGTTGPADLSRLFANLDANGDGEVAAEELEARRGRGGSAEEVPEDDGRAPLMPWQRSLADALALVKKTEKPLLLCVNMDGEPASEQLARRHYRDPEFVELAQGFIPLLASPDRRNPRDRDDRGRRIPDPKFGRLVNRESIGIEPALFERYFRGERVAPRHVGVSPEGEILFDLYLLNDLSVIAEALKKHGNFETPLADVEALSAGALLVTTDAAGRELLEARFAERDDGGKIELMHGALDPGRETQHPELLHLGLRDASIDVRRASFDAIVANFALVPMELWPEALRAGDELGRSGALTAGMRDVATASTGEKRVRARRLARISAAAQLTSQVIDVDVWKLALASARTPAGAAATEDLDALYATLASLEERIGDSPADGRLHMLFAQTATRCARRMIRSGNGNPGFLLQDAQAAARTATLANPDDGLGWAYLASSSYLMSDFETAGDAASRALPKLVGWADTQLAAEVLDAFARSRTSTLYARLGSEDGWPAEWVGDVLAAYEVLSLHPHGSAQQVRAGLDVQGNLELHLLQARFLRRALRRDPGFADLHSYLRWQVLRDDGAEALLTAYDELDLGDASAATKLWYSGLAALVAAERMVEDKHPEPALAAYHMSVERFRQSVELEANYDETARHYVALDWAGTARVQMESGELGDAVLSIRQSVLASTAAFDKTDGLGNSPRQTSRRLMRTLRRQNGEDLAESIDALLAERGLDAAVRPASSDG